MRTATQDSGHLRNTQPPENHNKYELPIRFMPELCFLTRKKVVSSSPGSENLTPNKISSSQQTLKTVDHTSAEFTKYIPVHVKIIFLL